MKHKCELTLSAVCFLTALLCTVVWLRLRNEDLADRISPALLRFHVLANSNSRRDQELKAGVKDLLLEELREAADQSAPTGTSPSDAAGIKASLCEYVTLHHEDLEAKASAYLAGRDCRYPVKIEIARSHFPAKYYGDILLPSGIYDAVRVTLGQGRGRNWWCLLYPRLCFLDAVHAVIPEESKTELQVLLDEEDYEALTDTRDRKIRVRFRLLDWLFGA